MTLFQDTGGDPRAALSRLSDVLAFYSAAGDTACGYAPGFALRKASLAVSVAKIAKLSETARDSLFFAGMLHAIGAIGNAAYRKGEPLPERQQRMERWDVPAQGARMCLSVAALPAATADLVRWQAECWDGTGFPDQLRWYGIPPDAQCLALAHRFLTAGDPEEALQTIGLDSGRAFGPEMTRTFSMWFHLNAGEVDVAEPPFDALDRTATDPGLLLDEIADRIDDHNGVRDRWSRIARLAQTTATLLGMDAEGCDALAIAARVYGAGELRADAAEDTDFDPLSRLGIDRRAANGRAAAALVRDIPTLSVAADMLLARSEWYDGTGKPSGMRHGDIPLTSRILSASIAYDHLEFQQRSHLRGDRAAPAERLDTAAGTQLDPHVVRALLEAAKARA